MSVNCIAKVNSAHRPFPQAVSAADAEVPPTVIAKNATNRVNITAMTHESGTHRSVHRVNAKPTCARILIDLYLSELRILKIRTPGSKYVLRDILGYSAEAVAA